MGWLYLGGRTIQELGDEMMMSLSMYGVAVMDGSLYFRFYGMSGQKGKEHLGPNVSSSTHDRGCVVNGSGAMAAI